MLEALKEPSRPGCVAANDSIVIEVGGSALALRTSDQAFHSLLAERYRAFVNPSARVHSEFDIELMEAADEVHPDADVQVKEYGRRWRIERGDFRAEWDPQTGRGQIRQSANPYSADTVLRIVHSLLLARQGGFLLHAASAIRNGHGFLFSGISGAGKTTISRLAPADATLLTDEISYVKQDGDGYRVCGTPFAGELAKVGENVSAPLSTVFFLAKGPENAIETIPPNEAARLLLRNILFFANDPQLVNLVFQTACNFIEKVPAKKLVFVPDERVWEMISPARN